MREKVNHQSRLDTCFPMNLERFNQFMYQMNASGFQDQNQIIELRNGEPYAKLILDQVRFAEAVSDHFKVSSHNVVPTAGTTGAIEAVRNHVFRHSMKMKPAVLTVSPGYWRARESFQGFGFEIIDTRIQQNGFEINELDIIENAVVRNPELIYLSLPNNPTGAIFEPEEIISGVPEKVAVLFDLTLPSRELDTTSLISRLYKTYSERKNLFLASSTSKSHGTAVYRIGWVICTSTEDALDLKKENRNVISTLSIEEGIKQIGSNAPVLDNVSASFALLYEGEKQGKFEVVKPKRMAETCYILIKIHVNEEQLKKELLKKRISVMWGSEYGITDTYMRLETSNPKNIEIFVNAINSLEI